MALRQLHAPRTTVAPRRRCERSRRRVAQPPRALAEAVATQPPWLVVAFLASSATLFAGTFFVAPKFSSEFREPETWEDIYAALRAQGVQSFPAKEAAARLARPALPWSPKPVLLDVRLAPKPREVMAEIPGSVRAPLYKYITSNNLFALARKAAFAFFAVPGTERNETFLDAVRAAVPDKSREVIIACMRGGNLNVENKPGVSFGFSSPSLKAVYVLRQAGYKNVTHLGGGIYEWVRAGQPAEEVEG